jgi:hypothetical protein
MTASARSSAQGYSIVTSTFDAAEFPQPPHERSSRLTRNFLLLPALLDDLIAAVPRRPTGFWSEELVSFSLPVAVKGFDVIAVWHARVDEDPAHQWLRGQLARITRTAQRLRSAEPSIRPPFFGYSGMAALRSRGRSGGEGG